MGPPRRLTHGQSTHGLLLDGRAQRLLAPGASMAHGHVREWSVNGRNADIAFRERLTRKRQGDPAIEVSTTPSSGVLDAS